MPWEAGDALRTHGAATLSTDQGHESCRER